MEPFFDDVLDHFGRLHNECKSALEGLSQDALDWKPGPGMNSIGVLVAHMAGAERYWIGDVVMNDPSGRVREEEFRSAGVDAVTLAGRLDASLDYMRRAFEELRLVDLGAIRASPRDDRSFKVGWAIAHALAHTALHLGHIQITRQDLELKAARK